jgi:hypothetical protein
MAYNISLVWHKCVGVGVGVGTLLQFCIITSWHRPLTSPDIMSDDSVSVCIYLE